MIYRRLSHVYYIFVFYVHIYIRILYAHYLWLLKYFLFTYVYIYMRVCDRTCPSRVRAKSVSILPPEREMNWG